MWLTAAVTVSVPITHPGLLAVAVLLQDSIDSTSSSELFTVVRPSIWDKSRDFEIGQWGRPWLVWYVPCKRRSDVFPGSLNSNTDIVIAMNDRRWCCESHSVGTQWQSIGEPHYAIFTVSDELSLESPIKWQLNVLLQSLASIPQVYQSILQINRQNAKLFTRNHAMCFAEKNSRMRPGCSHRVRRDLNTDVSVFDWHARLRLAPRWRLAVAKGLRENCRDVGRAPARKVRTVICQRSGQHYLKSGGPTYI